jgi:hypothetical protein
MSIRLRIRICGVGDQATATVPSQMHTLGVHDSGRTLITAWCRRNETANLIWMQGQTLV